MVKSMFEHKSRFYMDLIPMIGQTNFKRISIKESLMMGKMLS